MMRCAVRWLLLCALHTYSQGFGGRIAMEAYLATLGRDKVGFTVVGRKADAAQFVSTTCAGWSSATACATSWRSRPL